MTILSYKYRIEPNRAQSAMLSELLGDFCELYNASLEHRIAARKKGVSVRYYDQTASLPQIRKELPHQGRWSATAQQRVLRRLDNAFGGFFNRIKRGGTPGYPRFRARDRYDAADFRVGDGLTLRKSSRVKIIGIPGEIKVRWHRDLPSKPKSAIVSRKCGKWSIIFQVENAAASRSDFDSVGLDLGLTSLVAMSNGETICRPNTTKRNAQKTRRLQRALARCQRGSKIRNRRKASLLTHYAHLAAARRDFLHKASRKIVNRFGRIALEDLNIKGLARSVLAKDVHDASWGRLTEMISYKAENAGCELVMVDPRGTSQTCPECGTIAAKTLATREHRCECGCALDRDVAAAIVVHQRAFSISPGAGDGSVSQRVAA